MKTLYFDNETIQIPLWVSDHASFRRWVDSNDFPDSGRICFIADMIWVDKSKEQFFTHNQLKNELAFVLTGVIKAERMGRFVPDGMLLSNLDVGFTTQPDGAFVSNESLRSGKVKLIEGASSGFVELEGTPDLVLEIVSDASVKKDTLTLVDQYWEAGIPEYWLIDARAEVIRFDILRHTSKGYAPARKQASFAKSLVLGKSFRLTRGVDEAGNPDFSLEVR
jgi:Uma2 family endonuclease